MRGSLPKYRIALKRKQRRRLESIVRRRQIGHWLVLRAQIVLVSAKMVSVQGVAAALSIDTQRVRRWRKRFCANGIEGLRDRQRGGRPPKFNEAVWRRVATLVVQSPKKYGLPIERWTLSTLSQVLAKRYRYQVSRASVGRFLRRMALRPHRVKYWLNPSDPDFDNKARRICRLYVRPPSATNVISLDEKPGVPIRSRRHPDRPLRRHRPRRIEFEYKRHGTCAIFAAFNVQTGNVLTRVYPDRKTPRVLEFLDLIAQSYPRGQVLIVTDNIHTRRGKNAKDWLARNPRFRFVFTPYHGSWLNQVEIWLGILTRSCLRHAAFTSRRQIATAVYAFTRYWNRDIGGPFNWTYTGKVLHA